MYNSISFVEWVRNRIEMPRGEDAWSLITAHFLNMWLPKNKKDRETGKMIVTDIIEGLGMWRLGASMGLRLTLTIFSFKNK